MKYRHHSYLDVELKTNLRNTVFKKMIHSDFLKDFMFSTFYQHYQKDYDEISTYLNNHVFSSSNNKVIVDFDGNFDFNDYYLISLNFSFDRTNISTSKTSSVNEKLHFFLKHLQDVFNKNHYKHFIFIEKENKTNVDKSYVEFNHLIASKAQEAKRKILAELLNQKDNLDVLIEMVNEELIKQKSDNDDNFNLTVGENSIISKIENLENNIKTIFQQLKLL